MIFLNAYTPTTWDYVNTPVNPANLNKNETKLKEVVDEAIALGTDLDTTLTTLVTTIGDADDTGGTSTAGTVMGKLNKVIDEVDSSSALTLVSGSGTSYATYTGTGLLMLIPSAANTFFYVTIDDGTEVSISSVANGGVLHIPFNLSAKVKGSDAGSSWKVITR